MRFIHADQSPLPNDQCQVTVELRRDSGGAYTGSAVGSCDADQTVHTTALATLDAVRQATGLHPEELSLYGVSLTQVLGKRSVFVVVSLRSGHNVTVALLGSCLVVGDTNRASALAVLNATNRFLGLG